MSLETGSQYPEGFSRANENETTLEDQRRLFAIMLAHMKKRLGEDEIISDPELRASYETTMRVVQRELEKTS